MNLLIAPIHYIIDPNDGSEYTRAYEYLLYLSKQKEMGGVVLAGWSPLKKIGNFTIITYFSEKPAYISNLTRLKFIWWVYQQSRRLLKQQSFDCIWHNGPFAIGETWSLLGIWNNTRIPFVIGPIFTPLTISSAEDFGQMGKKTGTKESVLTHLSQRLNYWLYFLSRVFTPLSYLTMKRATTVLTMEPGMERLIRAHGVTHVHTLPLTLDATRFTPTGKILDRPIRQLFTIGYFIPRKGMADILAALDILIHQKHYKDLHLTMVGDGPEWDNLRQMVADRRLGDAVSFPGFIPREKIHDWYINADVLISGSISESMAGIYFEGMAAGQPLVVVSNPTTEALKEYGFGGIVVPAHSPQHLAQAIESLIRDPHTAATFRTRNMELTKTRYNFHTSMQTLISYFTGKGESS